MAATPETHERSDTTASPLDRHASPVADHTTPSGRKDGRATAGMIISIIAIPLALLSPIIGVIVAVVGLVLGAVAKGDIRRTGKTNYSQAKWAVILGVIAIAIAVINFIVGVAIFASNT